MKRPETRLRQLANGHWVAEAKGLFKWRSIEILVERTTGRPVFYLLRNPDSSHWGHSIMVSEELAERNRLHFLALKGF